MKQEIEILFRLNQSIKEAEGLLMNLRAEQKGSKHTIDEYFYNTKTNQFAPNTKGELTECLRIRTTKDAVYYTYKDDVFLADGSWSHSNEYETKISDAETMRQALARQYYEPLVTIDSHKTKYQLNDFEFTLEEVKELGTFLEIEHMADSSEDVSEIKDGIRSLAKNTGFAIDSELTIGKPELLLRQRGGW